MTRHQSICRFASPAPGTLVAFTLLLALTVRADDKADLNQEITLRCIYDVGEFGNDAVQACMQTDLAAAEALTKYPAQAQAIVDRCMKAMWVRGYRMVQRCVDQDIAAAAALGTYSAEHSGAIDTCVQKVGKHGSAKVKACVDAAIGPQQAGQQ